MKTAGSKVKGHTFAGGSSSGHMECPFLKSKGTHGGNMDRILLVEDDESLAMGIEYSLVNEDYEVKIAGNIREGFESFRQQEFQLVLLDVMLPDGNGFDLCKQIRKESDIPVIFLTACDEEVNIVQGLDLGGDDYITKPFRLKELISRIKAALRRAPGDKAEKARITSKDITLYPLETKVTKSNAEICLTPVEFRLLSLFMQNPLQTLSRELILEKLWDIKGEFVNDNALSVFVRRLREKLEVDPSQPEYIVTVRGAGYKWDQRSN